MASDHMLALRAGAIVAGVSALITPLPTAYAALAWNPSLAVLRLPSSRRLTAWLPALGHTAQAWMTNHAYYPWTAWMLTAQHVSLIAIAAGLSSLIGLGMTVKIARDNGSFSRFGGPAATGHGEHGTAHWRPMSGIGGVQEGFALWLPPKPAKPPKPQPESLPRPNAELMLPPNPSVVAAKIAEDYHRGIEPPPNPKARRPPEPYRPSGLMVGLAAQKPSQGAWTLARD